MKITRRQLAGAIAFTTAAAAEPQTPEANQAATEDAEIAAARERLRRATSALANHQIPMATEPAFQFKA